MNTKFSLALIALIGVGVFALPSTVALFAGQHSFYNIDATGNQVPCQKCHGDVKAELTANAGTVPGTPGPHAAFKCEYCHRIEAGAASGDNAVAGIPYVNATGVQTRAIVVSVADMEAGNIPDVINGTDQFVGRTLAGVELLHGGGSITANTSDATLNVSARHSWRVYPTYDTTTGDPLDTDPATKDGGLDPSKVTVDAIGAHSLTLNFTGAGSKSVNAGSEYHAASLVACMECHGGEEPMGHYTRVAEGRPCSDCHYGAGPVPGARWTDLAAGGFGLTTNEDDTGNVEAHNAWVTTEGVGRFGNNEEAIREGKALANNDACVACHTHVAVDINFEKGYKLVLDATETAEGVYSVSNSAVEGHVAISVYGNQSGETFAVGDQSITWTPTTTLYINGDKADVINGLDSESSDSEAALRS